MHETIYESKEGSNDSFKFNINALSDETFDTISHFSIVLKSIDEHQRHVGLFIKDEFSELSDTNKGFLIHQPFHQKEIILNVADDYESLSGYFSLECFSSLTDLEKESLPIQIYNFVKYNPQGLDYSVNYRHELNYFEQFKFVKFGKGEGLTCATFILECFKHMGYHLIQAETWVPRTELGDWPQNLIDLGKTYSDKEHFLAQKSDTYVRFRPEEVAVACILYIHDNPKSLEEVAPHAEILVRQLNQHLDTIS